METGGIFEYYDRTVKVNGTVDRGQCLILSGPGNLKLVACMGRSAASLPG